MTMPFNSTIGAVAVWLVLASVPGSAAANSAAADARAPAHADDTEPVALFRAAKRSDDPKRDYGPCIDAFRKLIATTSDRRVFAKSHYYLAFAHFLQREFPNAIYHTQQMRAATAKLEAVHPLATLANSLSDKLERDAVTFEEVVIAMAAQQEETSAQLAGALLHYAQTADPVTDKDTDRDNERLQTAAVALALHAAIFEMPMDEAVEKLRQATCVSHLHELITAWRQYRRDHGGVPVPVSRKIADTGKSWQDVATWVNLMQAYINDPKLKVIQPGAANVSLSLGTCLSCPSFIRKEDGTGANISSHCPHFAMNSVAFNKDGDIADNAMVFIDSNAAYLLAPSWGMDRIEYRHSDGVNCAFADGRVQWFSREEIELSAKKWQKSPFWRSNAAK